MSPRGHTKVPQVGRVIIQDDVEIGANTAIDRGAIRDTVIGEGTKIDNLVQVGHNVSRSAAIVSLLPIVAIAGSVTLEDFVALGGRATINNHVTIGEGAQVAGMSGVNTDIPPGGRYAGLPAKPAKLWMREVAWLDRAAKNYSAEKNKTGTEGLNPMNDMPTRLDTADIARILKALPHRYPFLMIDRVVGMRADEFAIGIKNVTANEPQFMGHFPENPVFPAC